jgi:hypothetical protein
MRGALAAVAIAAVIAAAGGAGCGGHKAPPTRDEPVIRIDCKIPQAVVVINDRELGTVRSLRRGIRLSPGTHRLVLRHSDYHTHYQILELALKERRVIDVELAEKLH